MKRQSVGALLTSSILAILFGNLYGCRSSDAALPPDTESIARLKDVSAALQIYREDNENLYPPFIENERVRAAIAPYAHRESSFVAHDELADADDHRFWTWNHKLAGKSAFNLGAGGAIFAKAVPTFYDPISSNGSRLVATLSREEPVRDVSDAEWRLIEDEMHKWPDPHLQMSSDPGSSSTGYAGEQPSEVEPEKPKWPRAWQYARQALQLFGKRATELEVLGEPTDVHEVKKGAWWVEEPYSGWLEDHNVFRWTQQGMQLNPSQRNSEPRAKIDVGIDKRTKLVSLVRFTLPAAVGTSADDWDIEVSDAAELLGISGEPLVTYYNQAPFGGFNLLTVFRKENAYVAIRSSASDLFEQSSRTDFDSGKVSRSSRLKKGVSLEIMKVSMLYLGPRMTKFNFNGINQQEVNDLLAMPLKKVTIPRGSDTNTTLEANKCKLRLQQLRQYISTLPDNREISIADSGLIPVCPVGNMTYTYNRATRAVQCRNPGHERF